MDPEHESPAASIALPAEEPLIGVLADEQGRRVVRYGSEDAVTASPEARLRAALSVVGAWRDLDWEELSAELDRIRHSTPPTPPIDL